jgi:BRCT domain type II-containing protein
VAWPNAEKVVVYVSGFVVRAKKTDYVVVGIDPGSKYNRAKRLGVPVLSESDFEKLVSLRSISGRLQGGLLSSLQFELLTHPVQHSRDDCVI